MGDKYDKNGYGGSDFKRNAPQEDRTDGQDGESAPMNDKTGEYMRDLLGEKVKLDQSKYPLSAKLLDQELDKVQTQGRGPPRQESRYVDIYREKPVKVSIKVLVPVKEHPKFNFVGKLLGPKGNSMKRLQEDTMCKMAVLGRGSMKDRQKEEELRCSLEPKYAHLAEELHVEVTALAPPAEAHARVAYALAELRKYLTPDANDPIRQGQIREMMEPGGMRRAPPPRAPPPPSAATPRVMPAKTKIMSILDRARTAMEESYVYDDVYAPPVRARAPEPEYYYERHYYEEEPAYYKEEPREYKVAARDVGSRRAAPSARYHQAHHARAEPYARLHK